MEITDWILILTALFLGACALFVPYLAEIVKRKAFAPNLKILFELAPPFCHQTSWRSPPGSPTQIEEPVYYFRFQVVNEGKTQARLCEVFLENLWIYDSANNPQPYPNFSPVNMIWVGASNEFININPNRRVFSDIGHISSANYQREMEQNRFIDIPGYRGNDLRFVLDLRQIFYSQPNCFGPGRYILQVGLYSENAGYQKEFFDISWSGRWQDGDDEMFREIVIARTRNPI
ncbi:MAG: hypothetical protein ACTSQH_02980 [Candidatus Hodarchaeales archaeon]